MMLYEHFGSAKPLKELEIPLDHSQGEHEIPCDVNVFCKKHCGHLDFEEHWKEWGQHLALQCNHSLSLPEYRVNVALEEMIGMKHCEAVDCELHWRAKVMLADLEIVQMLPFEEHAGKK